MKRRSFLLHAAATPLAARQVKPESERAGPWIHTPRDGRPPREVFVDGQRIKRAVYADERLGIVRYHAEPLNVHKDGSIETREVRGVVTVRVIKGGRHG